jgi:hypothetical protein
MIMYGWHQVAPKSLVGGTIITSQTRVQTRANAVDKHEGTQASGRAAFLSIGMPGGLMRSQMALPCETLLAILSIASKRLIAFMYSINMALNPLLKIPFHIQKRKDSISRLNCLFQRTPFHSRHTCRQTASRRYACAYAVLTSTALKRTYCRNRADKHAAEAPILHRRSGRMARGTWLRNRRKRGRSSTTHERQGRRR